MGLDKRVRFSKTVSQDTTVGDMRQIIRQQQKVAANDGLVLISNGQSLKNPEITMADLGICNDSMIICIISKEKGRDIEKLIGDDEEANYKDESIIPVLKCEFEARPFGFAVWANERGENAIVTKVSGRKALHHGIQIGYCVYDVNNIVVFNCKHSEVLECLKTTKCPIHISFVDMGHENTVSFDGKPLGFTVVQDKEENNAKVSKINLRSATEKGVKIGSYVISVNDNHVFGMKHKSIVHVINNAKFPMRIRLRRPPKLQLLPKEKKTVKKKKKIFSWAAR